jgi:hypothetical protein
MEKEDERSVANVAVSKDWQKIETMMMNGIEKTRDLLEVTVDTVEIYKLQGELRNARNIVSQVRTIKSNLLKREEANED